MPKRVTLRMCVSCRARKEKEELLKVVRTVNGEAVLDKTYKLNGRGAYICKDIKCLEKCIKTKALNRVLKVEVSDELLEELKQNL